MKLSVNWLREVVDPKIDNTTLIEQLTMAGLEVEALDPACQAFEGVYTAEIIEVSQHPDADKLKVCTVKYNNEELAVVCGDPTVSTGSKVALATVGAKLQNGNFKIKKSKLRGVESYGMLCSQSELGLTETSSGIWVLPDSIELNLDLFKYLQLDDHILELGLTPNRGDCFSIRGIAREVAVLNNIDVSLQASNQASNSNKNFTINSNLKLDIENKSQEACPRYVGRVVKNLNPKALTPFWMRERLRRSGIRSLYPLVDVTNYVMLELGQPMHAFDLGTIESKVIIRQAQAGEKLQLLDNSEINLSSDNLLICDQEKILALAGVMGGASSAISEQTTDVFLESAFFKPESIAKTARQFNMVTDSSQRFERGVDPAITELAIDRATELLLEIAGLDNTEIGLVNEVISENLATQKQISLRHSRIKRILGIEIENSQVENILTKLGLKLLGQQEDVSTWLVPSHRFDINIEVDLIEELARVYGYNNIPNNIPSRTLDIKNPQEEVVLADKIRNSLSSRGYFEAINYSFIDAKYQADFSNQAPSSILKLINPISSEMGELRLSLCPGLLKAAEYNSNHQAEHIKLFEIGKCFYTEQDGSVMEKMKLAGILVGKRTQESWTSKSEKVDFYDAKGDLESLFDDLGFNSFNELEFKAMESGDLLHGLHPGRSASILVNNKIIGWVGAVHPEVSKKTKIDNPIILFELSLEELQIPGYTKYEEISKLPQIRRDLAFLLKNEIKVQNLYDIVAKAAKDLLQNIYIFDVYQGVGIPEGYKSIAFAMVLQHKTKTLVDEEIVAVVNKVIKDITEQLGGKLRE